MKLNIKGLAFMGFAAAVFASAANAVTPNPEQKNVVTSKYYVDSLVNTETNDMATETWVGNQGFLKETDISGKQDIQIGNSGDAGKAVMVANDGKITMSASALGSAAYTASTAYATSAQGALADTAVQPGDSISNLNNDAGYITSADVPTQVKSNWNETDTDSPAYIQNKPTDIVNVVNTVKVNGAALTPDGDKAVNVVIPAQVQADWTEADSTATSYIANKPNLATVATSGSYTDLDNKPTVDTSLNNGSGNAIANSAVAPDTTTCNATTPCAWVNGVWTPMAI